MRKKAKAALALAVLAAVALSMLTACDILSFGGGGEAAEKFSYPYILPNTYIANIAVGGLSKEDALARLDSEISASFVPITLTVNAGDTQVFFDPEQSLALENAPALVDEAYNNGRTGNDKTDYDAAIQTEYRIDASPVVTINYEGLRTQVERAVNGLVGGDSESVYELSDDAVVLTRGQPSSEIDADRFFDAVKTAFESGQSTLDWAVEAKEVKELDLDKLWKAVNVKAVDAHYDPETSLLVDSVTGVTFDLDEAKKAYEALDYGQSCEIKLDIIQPEITSDGLADRLFADLLSSCDSTLEGSTPNRRSNLELVCKAINGTIVQPGEVFSYNDTVGERTAEKGYLPAGVYIGGQTQDQLGGGICQGASTIYLATMRANLEVVERTQHDFLVTYVPMGCDATVYWEVYDYKFRNTTAFPLRIDAWVADGYVHVELWGTNLTGEYAEMTYEVLSSTGYDYDIVEDDTKEVGYEEITTYPYTGYSVNTYRNVYDKDGNLLSTTFEARTNYKSRNQVTTIGTKGKEPEPSESTEPVDAPVEAVPVEEEPVIILEELN